MRLPLRHLFDKSFSGLGIISILLMGLALLIILAPVFWQGAGAVFFRATIEHRRMLTEQFDHGDRIKLADELSQTNAARQPLFDLMTRHEAYLLTLKGKDKREAAKRYQEFKDELAGLLGPLPGQANPALLRDQYGACRWSDARTRLRQLLFTERWDYPVAADGTPLSGHLILEPRVRLFAGTPLEAAFPLLENQVRAMLNPKFIVNWQFFTDESRDAHIFGGIKAELLGTFYLTLGAMLFAIPIGILSAIWLAEYASQGLAVSFLRTCISTLAGVPSIVFGLFGLAFFINTIKVSNGKSVLAGSLTLALMILPTVIRAAEEAIKAVPRSYKEAALALGAGRWRTILTVILPAALPGILTGIVISMGRAAGETAPIIFTAAVSVGSPLMPWQVLSEPTPALPWNIYNLAAEHEAAARVVHVQYGMVATLVLLVLLLNLGAIILRARVARKLRG
jgi:phosphate transport system permease protein